MSMTEDLHKPLIGSDPGYHLTYFDAFYAAVIAISSAVIGGISAAAVHNAEVCHDVDVAALQHSMCTISNYIYSGLCPAGYQSFNQTCTDAINNGTTLYYDFFAQHADYIDGMPEMSGKTADAIYSHCQFPAPADPAKYVGCVGSHIIMCSNKMFDGFATLYKENRDNSACVSDMQAATRAAGLSTGLVMLLVFGLASTALFAWRNSSKPSAAGFYGHTSGGVAGGGDYAPPPPQQQQPKPAI